MTTQINSNIVDAVFVSCFEKGFRIECPCKVNMETKQVFAISNYDVPDELVLFLGSYVRINNAEIPICYKNFDNTNENNQDVFWCDEQSFLKL